MVGINNSCLDRSKGNPIIGDPTTTNDAYSTNVTDTPSQDSALQSALNSIESLLGFNPNIPLPSCFWTFIQNTGKGLSPIPLAKNLKTFSTASKQPFPKAARLTWRA